MKLCPRSYLAISDHDAKVARVTVVTDLPQVMAQDGPLPHPAQDMPQ